VARFCTTNACDYSTLPRKHEVDKTGIYPLLQINVLGVAAIASVNPYFFREDCLMELRLSPTTMPTTVRPGMAQRLSPNQVTGGAEGGFSGALKSALGSVSAAQNDATRLQKEVQMENPNVSLEQTMVAIQKAQIGFQATLHVRNRMVQAYTDIMNMQV
jgi:flagellar hook-basal body complex protein FliE